MVRNIYLFVSLNIRPLKSYHFVIILLSFVIILLSFVIIHKNDEKLYCMVTNCDIDIMLLVIYKGVYLYIKYINKIILNLVRFYIAFYSIL